MIHLKIAKHKKLHTVIVAGGNCNLKEYSDMLAEAFLIGADRGALMLVDAGYNVDLAVGDFDSVSQAELERIYKGCSEVDSLMSEKNDTDLEHAIKRAAKISRRLDILGATGTRADQTFAALNLLRKCYDLGLEAYIHDSNNRIRIIKDYVSLKRSETAHKYVSLIPYGKTLIVTLRGFKYSGDNIVLKRDETRGVSNEITDDVATISCHGFLYIFESDD